MKQKRKVLNYLFLYIDNDDGIDSSPAPKTRSIDLENESFSTPTKRAKTINLTPQKEAKSTPKDKLNSFKSPTMKRVLSDANVPSSPQSSNNYKTPTKKQKVLESNYPTPSKEKNEDRYEWLENVRDIDMNGPGDEEYNPSTLYIPPSAWSQFTPFEKQYWEVKCQYFDSVVFCKKGKFYELYENDADIGAKEFDLKMTERVNMRMVGVPEATFEFWAAKFIARGYKVARMDQLETSIGKSLREKDSKKDKVIRRELTAVLTAGTLVDSDLLTSDMAVYCCALKERRLSESQVEYSVVFCDTSTAQFYVSHFEDDEVSTKLETLMVQVQPKEIVYERNGISKETLKLMKRILPGNTLWQISKREFPGDDFIDLIKGKEYFSDELMNKLSMMNELTISCLGGLYLYLDGLKLGDDLLSMKRITEYDPLNHGKCMILDGSTLKNLEIFGENGLFNVINKCSTAMGKRMLKNWVCYPLKKADEINERYDAIDELYKLDLINEIQSAIGKLPDVERLLSRIHCGGCKLNLFLNVIDSLEYLNQWLNEKLLKIEFESKLINTLLLMFPKDFENILEPFVNGFDRTLALKEGSIIPNPRTDKEYDSICDEVELIKQKLHKHLQEQKQILNTTDIRYKDIGKDLFQIEVPVNTKVPMDYIMLTKTKNVKRYHNPTLKNLVKDYQETLEKKSLFLDSYFTKIQLKFDENYSTFMKIANLVSQLDCLCSLAKSRDTFGLPFCRPTIQEEEFSFIDFEDLYHPILKINKDIIPNTVKIRSDNVDASMIIVTGANMGGKSTLLRQTCLGIILAQIGCYIPAKSCTISPVDRIFTRIGAHDNIMAGQSTFMVELSETSKILREATPKSMVILDELGRGTSTFDGYSIAYSVLHYLSNHIKCMGLFATHYHSLTQDFSSHSTITNYHMAIHTDELLKQVTFLYKFVPGVCPKSHGMNVAKMAGLPISIIEEAERIAKEFEECHQEFM
ncbi:hypothetical protein ROZALSC1DRAFT_29612 [Rozella allomycis CSF55]|uniref:DNA mismatch repair proteins mutS family domain-containing protein n=1 Tax=Rozella allomycis (strain CSF55) TaxID=988480 RepID=A0A4P9YGT0_ROZAC|nr:hypothetical protein ROZALSC1DRAFT_29612 [Rozella allomycis CSF55]